MIKLISTLVYLEGDFIKRTCSYFCGDNEDAIVRNAIVSQQSEVARFIVLAGNRGECTIGDIIDTPAMPDGSRSLLFTAVINKQRYSFYVQVADTQSDTI